MPLQSGQRIGAYEIVSALGAGGMGEVYRARDSKLKRDVAIKVLPASVADDRERLARFQREAEVLASLNHAHIAHVYGIEANALVMELVDGEDLSQRIARGPLPVDETLAIAKQIAEALEAAHEQGIVHRDLKPANIKVKDDGTIKVLDFGLAKALDQEAGIGNREPGDLDNSPTITSPAMTQRGVILGTAAYMAPEQAKGRPVDRRADIWAFGCILYEMLSGQRTFKGDDVTDTITSVMRDTPDWTALPATTPSSIRTLLRRFLEKDPRKRAPHISVARMAIDDATISTGELMPAAGSASSVPPGSSRTIAIVAIACTVIALAIGWAGSRYFTPAVPTPSVVRFQIPTTPDATLQSNFNRALLAVSPDGRQVAMTADRLYIRSLADDEARPVPGTEGFTSLTHPAFSPDGQSIAFWAASDRTVRKINLATGAISSICSLGEGGYGLAWSGDSIYFAEASRGIQRVSENGGQPELIVPIEGRDEAYGPQMLPDGETLLFTMGTRNMPSWDTATIVAQSLRTKTRRVVLENATAPFYVKTGHLLFSRGGVLYAVRFDARTVAVIGQPVAVIEGVRRAAPGTTGAVQVAVSDGGTLAYVAGPVSTGAPVQISIFDRAGTAQVLNVPLGTYSHPRVSPDGSRVAITVDEGKETQVWIYGLDKFSAARRLTFGGNNSLAEWASDGQRVAFQSSRGDGAGIWWQRADGTSAATQLTQPAAGVSHVPQSFSPDDRHLLFDQHHGNTVTLWDWSIADQKAVRLAIPETDVNTDATFSPDGHWFAYTIRAARAAQSMQSVVYVEPYPPTGARYQISVPGEDGHHAVWSRDGKELFYTPGPGNRFHAKSIATSPAFSFGEAVLIPRPFVNAPPSSERTYDVMPDGRILGVRTDVGPDGRPMSPQVRVVLNWFEELKQRVPDR